MKSEACQYQMSLFFFLKKYATLIPLHKEGCYEQPGRCFDAAAGRGGLPLRPGFEPPPGPQPGRRVEGGGRPAGGGL